MLVSDLLCNQQVKLKGKEKSSLEHTLQGTSSLGHPLQGYWGVIPYLSSYWAEKPCPAMCSLLQGSLNKKIHVIKRPKKMSHETSDLLELKHIFPPPWHQRARELRRTRTPQLLTQQRLQNLHSEKKYILTNQLFCETWIFTCYRKGPLSWKQTKD